MKITIPRTVEQAQGVLASIDGLVTAKDWERAAIVAAFVAEHRQGERTDLVSSDKVMTPQAFADLGIAGLRSHNTVRRYVQAWESTGLGRPTPGEVFEVDDLGPFPATSKTEDATPGAQKVKDISQNTRAMAEAIRQNPKVAEVARQALMDRVNDPEKVARIKADPEYQEIKTRHANSTEVVGAISRLQDAIRSIEWVGANWGDLWEKASDFERGTLVEQVRQASAEVGVLQMYVATQEVDQ